MAYGGQSIAVTLKETLYDVVFTTAPADAVLSVTNKDGTAQTPLADGRTYRLPKSGNPYSASAFGYADANGAYFVTGVDDAPNVTLDALAGRRSRSARSRQRTAKEIMPLITVTSKDWPSQALTAESSGAYLLPDGEYNVPSLLSGYKSVRENFRDRGRGGRDPGGGAGGADGMGRRGHHRAAEDADDKTYLIGSPDELIMVSN